MEGIDRWLGRQAVFNPNCPSGPIELRQNYSFSCSQVNAWHDRRGRRSQRCVRRGGQLTVRNEAVNARTAVAGARGRVVRAARETGKRGGRPKDRTAASDSPRQGDSSGGTGQRLSMRSFIMVAVVAATAPAAAQALTPPIPLAAARAVFARAHTLCSKDDGRLWGVSLCGPLMLADPRTHAAISNVPVPGARHVGAFYRFTLPSSAAISDTWTTYDGIRFAQVIWPLVGSADAQAVTLMHESFHRIQPMLGFVVHGARNEAIMISGDSALDTETGRIWLRGEIHALRVALTSSGAARKKALSAALELRAYRHAILPSTVVPEHELDIMEGLAESTGIDVGLPRSRRIAYVLRDLRFVENSPSYARSFCYAIGPAYSELLDAVEPNWRHLVTMKTSIAALAAQAYGITVTTPSASAAEAILARYGGATIEQEEAARSARQAARYARYRAELVVGRTLRLPLGRFNFTYKPTEVDHFGSYGSVYHHLKVNAAWGTIVASHGNVLINRNFSVLTVAAPARQLGATVHGNGWVLTLSPGTKIVPDPRKPGSYTIRIHLTATR